MEEEAGHVPLFKSSCKKSFVCSDVLDTLCKLHLHAEQVCNCTCNMVKKIITAAVLQLFLKDWGRRIGNQILSSCAAGVEYWLHHTDPMTLSVMKTHPWSRITRHSMSLLMPVTCCRVWSWQFPTSSGFSQPELGTITSMPFCKIFQEFNEGHYILVNLHFFATGKK